MHKKIIIGIVVVGVLVFIASLLTPAPVDESERADTESVPGGQGKQSAQFLPWQIESTPQGSIRVFGLALGESTLQVANDLYRGGAEVSLFVSPDGRYKVEAYFDKVVLGGFSSKMILVMALNQEQQAAMYQRGTRVSSLGGSRKKATLAPEDLQIVFNTPVASLTYLTRARLDDEILLKRFGEPAKRIRDQGGKTIHWLYPDMGLDVALSEKGRAVLQYVPPVEFTKLMTPLLNLESEPGAELKTISR